MSKKPKREKQHIAPGPKRWESAAPVYEEQDQGDDRQDQKDRPQHDDDNTPPRITASGPFGPARCAQGIHDRETEDRSCFVCGLPESFKVVTPEIQAVLDALPAFMSWYYATRPGSPLMSGSEMLFHDAAVAYLKSIEPKPPSFPFRADDKVENRPCATGPQTITAVGRGSFLAIDDETGDELIWNITDNWTRC